MSHISLPQLAVRTGFTRRHLQRLAASGQIPNCVRTAGGHWHVKDDILLTGWIARLGMKKVGFTAFIREKYGPLRKAEDRLYRLLIPMLLDAFESSKPVPQELVTIVKRLNSTTLEWAQMIFEHQEKVNLPPEPADILAFLNQKTGSA